MAKTPLPSIIINNTNWPPVLFENSDKEPVGFGKDVLEICVKDLGYQPTFVSMSIQRMYKSIKIGTSDINFFSLKEGRDKFVTFSKLPLFQASYKPFVTTDSKIKIQKISDFDGLKLGHLNGIKYSPAFLKYIDKRRADGDLDEIDTDILNLKKLVAKRIDIFVGTEASTKWMAKENGLLDKIKSLDYAIKTSDYFLAVSKKSPRIKEPKKFLKQFDACVKKLDANGTYKKIRAKYGLN